VENTPGGVLPELVVEYHFAVSKSVKSAFWKGNIRHSGSFVDFMASLAHLQAPVAAQVPMVKSEAQCYLQAAPINTDPLVVEW
jgi:hypothetical protein